MKHSISIDLLSILEDATSYDINFNINNWRPRDIERLRDVTEFIEGRYRESVVERNSRKLEINARLVGKLEKVAPEQEKNIPYGDNSE